MSGVRGIDPATGKPAEGDERRLELIFAHLERILAVHGCGLRDVLSTRVYVTDMVRHRPLVNAAFQKIFGNAPPTRTILQVAALNQADSIEVEVVACCRERHPRRA